MITRLTELDKAEVFQYIGDERGKCLYMYLDILKFGLNIAEVSVWAQRVNHKIVALMMKYHNGFHIYAKRGDVICNEIIDLIKRLHPSLICGEKRMVQLLTPSLPEYGAEYGVVYKFSAPHIHFGGADIRRARSEDFSQIAQLLKEDEDYGAAFTCEELELQFRTRQEIGMSRSLVLYDGEEVIGHVATGAESEDIATVNGLVVKKNHRRQGLATKLLCSLCSVLQSEGKDVFSMVYVMPSANLHEKVGFSKYCDWGKLYLHV